MDRMLVNATQPEEIRVAVVRNDTLHDLDIEHASYQKKKANIYKGRVTRIEPSLGAAFIDYGAEKQGFLPFREISPEYLPKNADNKEKTIDIAKSLSEGQELLVQVDKIERGTKGAALTTYISIAGCYLVFMPNSPNTGSISRRIEGGERIELKGIISNLKFPKESGIIVRTAGLGKSAEDLQWDLDILQNLWKAIKTAFKQKPAPFLIHEDGDIVIRSIRDNLKKNIEEIIIDNSEVYIKAKNYIQLVRPDYAKKLKLYQDTVPLFTRFNIESQIELAHKREIILPAGGSIVIDKTEALIAIDINSAKATGGQDIEETALNTNLEAATEIAKQLRIRDIGGLIVIDFIDMVPIRNQKAVENHLRESLKFDRARVQIGRISKFGMLEMSRQRLRPSISDYSHIVCPRCNGIGTIRSTESLALTIIRVIEENIINENVTQITVQLPIEIATFLLNEKRIMISEIEKRSQVEILIIPNKHLKTPNYEISKFFNKGNHHKNPSYNLVTTPEIKRSKTSNSAKTKDTPLIKNLMSFARKSKKKTGWAKKIWQKFFPKKKKRTNYKRKPNPHYRKRTRHK